MGISRKAVAASAGGAGCNVRKKSKQEGCRADFHVPKAMFLGEKMKNPERFARAGQRQFPERAHGGATAPRLARPGPVSAAAASVRAHMAQYYHFMVTIMSNLTENESWIMQCSFYLFNFAL